MNKPTRDFGTVAIDDHSDDQALKDRMSSHTDKAKRQGAELAESAKQTGEAVKESAAQATEAVKDRAYEASERAKTYSAEYLRQQKQRAVDELGACCSAVRRAADKLDQESEAGVSTYVHALAEQLDRAKSHVERRDIRELFEDAQDLVRKRPELFYGGLFLAGLAGARFLKASQTKRQKEARQRTPSSSRREDDRSFTMPAGNLPAESRDMRHAASGQKETPDGQR